MRAYCYASTGRIGFSDAIPAGAMVIARGPDQALRDFIAGVARHNYQIRSIGGRRSRVPGSDYLAVPGIPEAENQLTALRALEVWSKWIAVKAPKDIRVLPR